MEPLIQLKKITSLLVIARLLVWFALLPIAQAVSPAPTGRYAKPTPQIETRALVLARC